MRVWAGRPSRPLGTGAGTARWPSSRRISTADSGRPSSRLGAEDSRDRGPRVRGPGAGPGVGGRDWRLLLGAAGQ